jgi:hypothetical protein
MVPYAATPIYCKVFHSANFDRAKNLSDSGRVLLFLARSAPISQHGDGLFVHDEGGEADGGGAVLVLAVQCIFRIFPRLFADGDALAVEELGGSVDIDVALHMSGPALAFEIDEFGRVVRFLDFHGIFPHAPGEPRAPNSN